MQIQNATSSYPTASRPHERVVDSNQIVNALKQIRGSSARVQSELLKNIKRDFSSLTEKILKNEAGGTTQQKKEMSDAILMLAEIIQCGDLHKNLYGKATRILWRVFYPQMIIDKKLCHDGVNRFNPFPVTVNASAQELDFVSTQDRLAVLDKLIDSWELLSLNKKNDVGTVVYDHLMDKKVVLDQPADLEKYVDFVCGPVLKTAVSWGINPRIGSSFKTTHNSLDPLFLTIKLPALFNVLGSTTELRSRQAQCRVLEKLRWVNSNSYFPPPKKIQYGEDAPDSLSVDAYNAMHTVLIEEIRKTWEQLSVSIYGF